VGGLQAKRSRDVALVEHCSVTGVLTARLASKLEFSLDSEKAAQRRMMKLYTAKVFKRLMRRSVNEPHLYYTRKPSIPTVDHGLGVAEIYASVVRGSRDLGFNLVKWLGPDALQPMMKGRSALAPDGYFLIIRMVDGQSRSSGFFVEHEQSQKSINTKLTRYADIFHSGYYRQTFGIRGMRVLFTFATGERTAHQAKATAERLGVTLARFISLDQVKSISPTDLLTAPVWLKAGEVSPVALFGG
jgi:hypothetical protein